MENLNRFIEALRRILSLKRTKVTLYIVAVLWLAFAMQIIMNRMLITDVKITQAFVNTNSKELKSSLDIIAFYDRGHLSEEDKKDLIQRLADSIGLTLDRDITVMRDGKRSEYSFEKQAKRASTLLKVVSLEQDEGTSIKVKHYIIIRLNITDSIRSVDRLKKLLEKSLSDIGAGKTQITLKYEGSIGGSLIPEEKKKIAADLVEELQGVTAVEYEENDIYTVYAYSGLIDEYIVSMGSKVNIQIVISYDGQSDRTMIYLATPILNFDD